MMRNRILLCVLIVSIILPPLCGREAETEPKKYALVVGLNDYLEKNLDRIPSLRWAEDDATALRDVLESQKYEVITLAGSFQVTREMILHGIYTIARKAQATDTVVIFFAGHGVRSDVNGKTYWLTGIHNWKIPDIDGIRVDHLMDYIRDIKAGRKLILLDHCFSGDVTTVLSSSETGERGPGVRGSPADDAVGLVMPRGEIVRERANRFLNLVTEEGKGMCVIAAAQNFAFESDKLRHGVFTHALIKALTTTEADKNNNNTLDTGELIGYLKIQVKDFVPDDVKALIEKAKQDPNSPYHDLYFQSIKSINHLIDGDDWPVARLTMVDFGKLEEYKKKLKEYRESILEWESKDWFDPDSKGGRVVWDVLVRWKDALSTGQELQTPIKEDVELLITEMERDWPNEQKAMRIESLFGR